MITCQEWLNQYESTTAADLTALGFTIGNDVFMIHLKKLPVLLVKIEKESTSHGGKKKLRLRISAKAKRILLSKGAIKVGTTSEIFPANCKNKGEQWETWYKGYYKVDTSKSNDRYDKAGDTTIQGIQIQIKWENASLATINTIKNIILES